MIEEPTGQVVTVTTTVVTVYEADIDVVVRMGVVSGAEDPDSVAPDEEPGLLEVEIADPELLPVDDEPGFDPEEDDPDRELEPDPVALPEPLERVLEAEPVTEPDPDEVDAVPEALFDPEFEDPVVWDEPDPDELDVVPEALFDPELDVDPV